MRLAGLVIIAIAAGLAVAPAHATQSSAGVRLEGRVVEALADRGLSGVVVQIAGLKTTSDTDGKFMFEKVPAGKHVLLADKSGYMRARPEGRMSGAGILLTLTADQTIENIRLQMFRSGAVSGRVLNSQGAPLTNALVIPYRYTYDGAGHLTLTRITLNLANSMVSRRENTVDIGVRRSVGLTADNHNYNGYNNDSNVIPGRTNDLGEFRIINLDAGKYSFYVVPPTDNGTGQIEPGIGSVFYPGVSNPVDAEIVEIGSGSDIHLRTISLLSGINAAVLGINVIDQTGFQGNDLTYFQVRKKGLPETLDQRIDWIPEVCAKSPESCSKLWLPAGSYEVEAIVGGREAGEFASTHVFLEMSGADSNLDIPVSLGTRILGKAVVGDADAGTKPITGLHLEFKSEETIPNILFPLNSDREGKIEFTSMPTGLYRVVNISGIPTSMCLDEVRQDERNVLRDGLLVAGRDVTFAAFLNHSQTGIQGTTKDAAGKAAPGAIVALVPDDKTLLEQYASATTDQNGEFQFSCLHPGEYHLYAWPELEGAAFRNAEFMKPFEDRGTPVHIERDGHRTIDLKLLEVMPNP